MAVIATPAIPTDGTTPPQSAAVLTSPSSWVPALSVGGSVIATPDIPNDGTTAPQSASILFHELMPSSGGSSAGTVGYGS